LELLIAFMHPYGQNIDISFPFILHFGKQTVENLKISPG